MKELNYRLENVQETFYKDKIEFEGDSIHTFDDTAHIPTLITDSWTNRLCTAHILAKVVSLIRRPLWIIPTNNQTLKQKLA
ncbi:hypothetical protein J6590_090991 [Homalodisca vitripennis]|nr:hypothetical protein J6590_090991 [Homalodisca vitripennis]